MEIIELTFLMLIILLVIIGVYIMLERVDQNKNLISEIKPSIKYQRTGLSENFSLELKHRLLLIMENDKPYLNSGLRLNHLADYLEVSRNTASQVINEHFNKNFFDFINSYRVMEAIKFLEADAFNTLSVSEVLYKSGFNSRASFYKAFKKIVGVTPTEFKNDCNMS